VLPACGPGGGVLCDPSTSDPACTSGSSGLTVDAAVLALNQSFVVNNSIDGEPEGCLTVYGSIDQYARGPVGTFSGATPASGYVKQYTWDPLLDFVSPPSYLVPSTPPWALGSEDPVAGSTDDCPDLPGVYLATGADGSIQDGPPVVQSCSESSGGLPGYP
jgi:hypothetical protein